MSNDDAPQSAEGEACTCPLAGTGYGILNPDCPIHKALPSADSQASAEASDAPNKPGEEPCLCHDPATPMNDHKPDPAKPEPQQPKTDELSQILETLRNNPNLARLDDAHQAIRQLLRTERVSELEWVEQNVSIEDAFSRGNLEKRKSELKGENR